MLREDPRASKIAIIPDYFVNPQAERYQKYPDAPKGFIELIEAKNFGWMKCPPVGFAEESGKKLIKVIVGDAVDYLNNDYQLVIFESDDLPGGGIFSAELEAEFIELGRQLPVRVTVPTITSSEMLHVWWEGIQESLFV